ncbi:hypothetical protein H1P_50029 [Hyella patelloides LEGE 07179]|uniref:Uncharacterized protein n=1 Tax=Hyella patelloides LEGE 07179 TaxID=945734 RepID=A0A563VZE2_9CYAN|nr:hypothetical protein H1P_50029 [Hyella patelloides LEGE 07179]
MPISYPKSLKNEVNKWDKKSLDFILICDIVNVMMGVVTVIDKC